MAFPWLLLAWRGNIGYDAYAYWHVNLAALYAGTSGNLNALGAFRYAPPMAFLFRPASLLPWPVFLVMWTGFLIGCIALLGRRRDSLAIAGFPPVAVELTQGNVNLPIAACAAFGFAYPGLWAFVLLTKPTCAVGLLWFAVRRDWRALAWAVGLTAGLAVPTILARPDLWSSYLAMLMNNSGVQQALPLLWRLPPAIGLVIWGALTDRRWTVPVAAAAAVPNLAWPTLAILAGLVPIWAARGGREVPHPVSTPASPTGGAEARSHLALALGSKLKRHAR